MAQLTESRKAARRRVLKGGSIVFNDGRSTIDCVVVNLSEGGARLRVVTPLGIPDSFVLRLSDSQVYKASVAWRKASEIGVSLA
jgi:hypothetical protein